MKHKDYKYCISRDDNNVPNETVMRETQMRKVQFIFTEIINDLGIQKGTAYNWAVTFLISFIVFELRMVVHYLGQYVFLKIINAPVTRFDFNWYKIKMEYSYWDWLQQIGVIMVGPGANTLVFIFMATVCHLSQRLILCFPPKLCKFIAWYGLATMLDFFLIIVIDLANQDKDGDLLKLYNYYARVQNSGFIGLFITFLVQFLQLIVNIFLFYYYICFVHCDARIQDIVIRITGTGKGYYIPYDNEISFNYLKQTYCLAEINNNRIVVNKIMVPSPFTDDEPRIAKSY